MNLSFKLRADHFASVLSRAELSDKCGIALDLEAGFTEVYERLAQIRSASGAIYVVGNGGSASVASHAVTDFFNVAALRATTLHDSALLTCMANDFGYEHAFSKMLSQMIRPDDMVIVISSSGRSMNMRNAVVAAQIAGAYVLTLSGFASDNPLRAMGDRNFWLNSDDYGFVEIGHQFILHNLADRFNAKIIGANA